jgi:hypothetical protein
MTAAVPAAVWQELKQERLIPADAPTPPPGG